MIAILLPNAGSVWRKWDFHVHTPESFHWKGKRFGEMTDQECDDACRDLIVRMNEADADAFVIMDYWTFDGYTKILAFMSAHPHIRLEKALFPGIELRCEAPTNDRLNIHVVFSDQIDLQYLFDFKSMLRIPLVDRPLSNDSLAAVARRLAPDKLKKLGFRADQLDAPDKCLEIGHRTALVSRESLFRAFDSIPKRMAYIFLPFDTYNGWHQIVRFMEHPLMTTEFMSKAHIFEARQRTAIDCFNGIRTESNGQFLDSFLQTIGGKPKPAVSGSDAHSLADYAVFPVGQDGEARCTWVKADTTFRGIGQILIEPATRVFIGHEPLKRVLVREHPTKYIRSLRLRKKPSSDFKEHWFDGIELHFNHDLVAIVGNKGTGKSALADIIGLLGSSKNHEYFSFLNTEKFCSPKSNIARHFEATLQWQNGEAITRLLNEIPASTEIERLRYLPQNYLETVCNEIKLRVGDGFDGELKSVIFSHVPFADRIGYDTLDGLINYKNKQIRDTIGILKSKLSEINVQLASLEKRSTPQYRDSLQNQLDLKHKEIDAHEASKPEEIVPPSTDPKRVDEATTIAEKIVGIRTRLAAAEAAVKQAESDENRLSVLIAKLSKVEGQLDNFERLYRDLVEAITTDLEELDIPASDVLSMTVNRTAIVERRASLVRDITQTKAVKDPLRFQSDAHNLDNLTRELTQLQAALDGPQKAYQEYLSSLAVWEREHAKLIGDEHTPQTLKFLKARMEELDILPSRIAELKQLRRSQASEIYDEITRMARTYRAVYQPVQDFTDRHQLINERFGLNFSVDIRPQVELAEHFFAIVHRGVSGSFCGNDEGLATFRAILDRHDFSTQGDALAFADELVDHLLFDRRGNGRYVTTVEKQLRKGYAVQNIYDFIYSFDYLAPRFNLNLGGKEVTQLSPGERGMLLLVFYLLIDKDDSPLIVDQPEGNLDNQTVFKLLGECIKEAKKRRQIIIVTHNPNLAVACDAEQVIGASLDARDGNRVNYVSGAIEDPTINQLVIDILEGTRPAFDNRDLKYFADA